MAFVHCHNCDWCQDDFWNFKLKKYGRVWRWGYNPIGAFWGYVLDRKGYLLPRRIEHDQWMADELGWTRPDPHSWWLIWFQFKRMIHKFRNQHWWTWEDWKKDVDKIGRLPLCPHCGKNKLDID